MQFAGDVPLERAAKTYVVNYRIRDGRLEINEFKEKNLRADAERLKTDAETEAKIKKDVDAKMKMQMNKQAEDTEKK